LNFEVLLRLVSCLFINLFNGRSSNAGVISSTVECKMVLKEKQDRQCTYYVTPRHVPATIVAVEKHTHTHTHIYIYIYTHIYIYILLVCVCSLRYPACNAHAPNCRLWPVRLYNIFPHCITNVTIFEKETLNIKCVF
jgi:hypothetical protein